MREPLEIEIDEFTFHVVVTGWPSRGGATSPPYGADWHLVKTSCQGEVKPFMRPTRAEHNQINDKVQDTVADWMDREDNQ